MDSRRVGDGPPPRRERRLAAARAAEKLVNLTYQTSGANENTTTEPIFVKGPNVPTLGLTVVPQTPIRAIKLLIEAHAVAPRSSELGLSHQGLPLERRRLLWATCCPQKCDNILDTLAKLGPPRLASGAQVSPLGYQLSPEV